MSEHMVRRDVKWRLWFLFSYVLGLMSWAYAVIRGYTHDNPHRVIINISTHHADILRTGGFIDPDEPVRFPFENEK